MQRRLRIVTKKKEASAEVLPDWLNEPAVVVSELIGNGMWKQIADRVKIQRVGYCGIDMTLFFIGYFGSGLRCGARDFCAKVARWSKAFGNLGERRWLPTQSSISRCLSQVRQGMVASLSAWLLLKVCDAGPVLAHPAAKTYDTMGQAWDMLDWDATSTVLRERALPSGSDLPNPERRSRHLAAPGYPGRKRGDVQVSRGTLQHAGTGLWLDMDLHPGRAEGAAVCEPILARLHEPYRSQGLHPSKSIIRADGAAGNVPWMLAVQRQGFRFITRSAHYTLLGQQDVQDHLRQATWYRVPDSCSGPERQCTDLGRVTLQASQESGDAKNEITVRMVVARFKRDEKHGAGILIDGWQYELFATDLDASAWPGPEIVEAYYGRSGQENRFYQEDQELELDRIYSYHLPGQQLVTLLGLFVWNLRICRGFQLRPPTQALPPQSPRMARIIPAVPEESVAVPAQEEKPTPDAALPEPAATQDRQVLAQALDALSWETLSARLPAPSRRSEDGIALVCPEGIRLPLQKIKGASGHATMPRLAFVAAGNRCGVCPQQAACTQSQSPHFVKEVAYSVEPEVASQIKPLLDAAKLQLRRQTPTPAMNQQPVPSPAPAPPLVPKVWVPLDGIEPGPLATSEVQLLPAEFRHLFSDQTRQLEIRVTTTGSPVLRNETRPLGVSHSRAQRQHRRRTWSERRQWNALPEDAQVTLQIEGMHSNLFASTACQHGAAA